jgi:5-methylcytosine-specific restriction endonuclease McrA
MGRPRRINHDAFLRLFDEIGVVKEAARRMGIHEQTAHAILRQSRGQCRNCPTEIPPSQKWCAPCRERIRVAEKALAHEHLRLGICVKCTDPIAWGRSRRYCETHVIAMVDYMRTHRRKRVVNTTGTTLEAEKLIRIHRDYGDGGVEAWTRDEGCCVLCGLSYADRAVYVHHIDRNRSHNTADNLTCLCYTCHRLVHGLSEHPHLLRFLDWFHAHYPAMALPQKANALLPRTRRKSGQPDPGQPQLFTTS